jgi:hypothetical protein
VLLGLASVVAFFACFAVWVHRQVLNTDNWTNTSSQLLANRQIDEALGTYLVNQLFLSENVPARLESALPSELNGIAGPLSAGLEQLADHAVPLLLQTSQVQEAWRTANRSAHATLIQILNGGGKVVSTKQGTVTLDLHQLVSTLGAQLGLSSQVATLQAKAQGAGGVVARGAVKQKLGITLPATSGQIVIMRATQLRTAQNIAKGIRGLAVVLPLLSLALFALAVWFADGWRRIALRRAGWCLFVVGVVLLLARTIAGNQIVNSLVATAANRPAAHAAWSIATSLLEDIAVALILYGLVFVLAAWVAGHTRPARFLRHALAPSLREHAVAAYVTGLTVLALVVIWGPTEATHQVLPVLGFAVLTLLGVWMLRSQAAQEFPDARPGEAMALLRQRVPFGRHHAEHAGAGAGAGGGAVEHAGAGAVEGAVEHAGGGAVEGDPPNGAGSPVSARSGTSHPRD